MTKYILKEGVLNDDYLLRSGDGMTFKGGFIAMIVFYKYSNSWSNSEHVIKFRKETRLKNYLKKHYSNFNY